MFLTEFDEEAYRKAMRSEGYDEGQEDYNRLITALVESNRMDDLKHAVKDKAFRKQLFHEFGIAK